MKEKDNNMSLAARLTGKDENNNIRRYPLFSAGEDFYSISLEEKSKGTEIIFSITGIKKKDEISSNGILASAFNVRHFKNKGRTLS